MEIEGGKDKAEALRSAIQAANQDTRVQIKSTDDVIHVTDIEGDIDRLEIAEAIQRSIGDAKIEDIKVLAIRPNRNGNQNATIGLPRGHAKKLISRESMVIGWTSCRVRARVNIVRCYRCLEFGHHSSECKGEDKSNMCLKCGKEGHKAMDCKNPSFCLTCKKGGHRAEQTKCPHFRNMINDKAAAVASRARSGLIGSRK